MGERNNPMDWGPCRSGKGWNLSRGCQKGEETHSQLIQIERRKDRCKCSQSCRFSGGILREILLYEVWGQIIPPEELFEKVLGSGEVSQSEKGEDSMKLLRRAVKCRRLCWSFGATQLGLVTMNRDINFCSLVIFSISVQLLWYRGQKDGD